MAVPESRQKSVDAVCFFFIYKISVSIYIHHFSQTYYTSMHKAEIRHSPYN